LNPPTSPFIPPLSTNGLVYAEDVAGNKDICTARFLPHAVALQLEIKEALQLHTLLKRISS
jgi:hypothetical protein